MIQKNKLFILTILCSILVHIPLYAWAEYFYFFPGIKSVETKQFEEPTFRYVAQTRNVVVSPIKKIRTRMRPSKEVRIEKIEEAQKETSKIDSNEDEHDLQDVQEVIREQTSVEVAQEFLPRVDNVDLRDTRVREVFLNYYGLLSAIIGRYAVYPEFARLHGYRGTAYVTFVLKETGHLAHIYLNHSSGNSLLDNAAINAIQRAAPFPPLPPEIGKKQIRLHVPISFQIER